MKKIVVDMTQHRLYALENGKVIHWWGCVIGRPGADTRCGTFRIRAKHRDYVSKAYKVPMPYTMFFDRGRAIHATGVAYGRSFLQAVGLGSVGSHGCVGLSRGAARFLFDWAVVGTPVEVTRTSGLTDDSPPWPAPTE